MLSFRSVVSVIAALASGCGIVNAQVAIRSERVASGLAQPVGAFAIPGDTGRLFIVEQVGRIRILDLTTNPPTLSPTPFLDLSSSGLNLTGASGERGLLGLAFDPNYVTNGRFYVNYTTLGSPFFTRIARFTANGAPFASQAAAFAASTANTGSQLVLLQFQQDFDNHNGGAIAFGPDGMLYVGSGDGGSANDPNERAQNLASHLGKILRLDVNDAVAGTDGDGLYVPDDNPFRASGAPADKIWAYGKRNPWRMSFDRLTGDLWMGDVGQDAQEEINFQPALTAANLTQLRGRNYGWDCREGLIATPASDLGCDPNNPPSNPPGQPAYTDPVKVYLHTGGACSVTGGQVYRGSAMPALQGAYFHADYCGNWVRSFRYNGTAVSDERDWTAQVNAGFADAPASGVVAIGEDAVGELYIVNIARGSVYKIVQDLANCGCPCLLVGNQGSIIDDNFEMDLGWTASVGPGVTDGAWERGIPVNDPAWAFAPFADSDGSGRCYLTANRLGNSDVDGGAVTLVSPAMDFSAGQITICYDYFLNLNQVGGANPDGLFFEISSNGLTGPWVRVASHVTNNGSAWTVATFTQAQLTTAGVVNTSNMRARFIAVDNASPGQSVVEAGVDAFRVYTGNPFPDCNGNGIDDAIDISSQTSADCNNNAVPDECDIAAALAAAETAGNPNLQIDLDGGLIGSQAAGATFFNSSCIGCHGANGTGGTGPNIRNKTRTQIRNRLYLLVNHPGGGFPGSTDQDHADIEYFLADGGSKGRPDRIIDACQPSLPDCDNDSVPDGRELQLQTQVDLNYNGTPDGCEPPACPCDFNGGGLSVQDIFDYLAEYFSNGPLADFNGVGGITVQDIFDFLACYFGGC